MKDFVKRMWTYQSERFPLIQYGFMVAAFSFCTVTYAARLGGRTWPGVGAYLLAFVVCFLFFMQFRIADEFKDSEEDERWRPYRPVPRGLVSKFELALLFALGILIQGGLTLAYHDKLLAVLIVGWVYLGAMSFKFGLRGWLKARPAAYLPSHMLLMPIIDFFGTACEWMPRQDTPPPLLLFFLAGSFTNGIVIELGRKIRSPEREEIGEETYSVLWGRRRAAFRWVAMVQATALLGGLALLVRGADAWGFGALVAGALLCLAAGWMFCVNSTGTASKRIETASGIWAMVFYLTLGLA